MFQQSKLSRLILSLITAGLFSGSSAQVLTPQNNYNDKWTLSVHGGPLLFYSDVKQYVKYPSLGPFNEIKYGFGVRGTRSVSPFFSYNVDLTYGRLYGVHQATKKYPNVTEHVFIDGNVIQLSVLGTLNISNVISPEKAEQRKLSFLASAGLGVGSYTTDLKETYSNILVKSYSGMNAVLPVSLGARYKINDRWNVGLEVGVQFTSSDNIDTRKEGAHNDNYNYSNISVGYKLHIPYGKKKAKEFMQNDSLMMRLQASTKDKDKDGVSNLFDKDSLTAPDVRTYGDGTSIDSDMDGIPDVKDAEPFSSKGAKVDGNGRELDGDGDKVPDSRDLEPDTKSGSFVDVQGRTIKVEPGSKQTSFFVPSVYFAQNKAVVLEKYHENLSNLAIILKENPEITLIIVGNADTKGNASLNPKMGMKRAQAVAKYLTDKFGIDSSRFSLQTNGSSNLLSTKDDLANRRVDFQFKNK